MRILVVEDEAEMADALVEALTGQGYAVDLARNGRSAAAQFDAVEYDLVLLDRSIPPPTGVELVQRWRAKGGQTPVLFLTGNAGIGSRVSGLDAGADDYLVKPFAFAELFARVRSLLRRREKVVELRLVAGDLVLDRTTREVVRGGSPVALSPKEFALLEYLLLNKGRVISRARLAEHVWDQSSDSVSNVLEVLIHRLRRKIDGDREGKLLYTVAGAGYVIKEAPL